MDSVVQAPIALPKGTLTVESVALYIKLCLEEDPNLHQMWVLGEISSVSRSGKGTFFTLQDPIAAQSIACVIWSSLLDRMTVKPIAGEQVLVLGSVKTYQSRYQIQVTQMLPAGEGVQALKSKQLYERLAAEGLFDDDRKRALPEHPQTIAVVTSPNAAAWGDIQTTLNHRYPGLTVLLSAATVQGTLAPASIADAIDRVVRDGRAEVLLLARGGGAVEDLSCFNDERVVRAIATCPIPVIAGIGHDRDESLADLVADYAAHTPTAAAERIVPNLEELFDEHCHRVMRSQDALTERLEAEQENLVQLQRRLKRVRPDRQLAQAQSRVASLKKQFIQTVRSQFTQHQIHHQHLHEKLTVLDPHAVLKRGYAVVRSQQQLVRSMQQLQIGDTIDVELGDGKVRATVTQVDR